MTPGPITPAGDPISPFTTITISDPDNEPVTVTVSVNPTQGSFITLAGFTHQGGGVYTMTALPASVTAALRGLVFLNAEGVVPPGSIATVSFGVHAQDPGGLSMNVTVEWMYFGGPPE